MSPIFPRFTRRFLECVLALVALMVLLPALGLGEANRFPIVLGGEAFLGKPLTVTVGFTVYFPVDETRYVPINDRLALFLGVPPEVDVPAGFEIQVLDSRCVPRELDLLIGQHRFSATGGDVSARLELVPAPDLEPGDYSLTVRFPAVDTAFRLLQAIPPAAPATARLDLRVWASSEAKMEAERKAEEARQQLVALEAERERQRRILLLKRFGVALGILAVAALPFLWLRRWIYPALQVTVAAGSHVQQPRTMLPWLKRRSAEPGSIVTTHWARSLLGRRQRIKVETLWTGARTDLLVSVGASVRPGRYVTRGAVRVTVPVSR